MIYKTSDNYNLIWKFRKTDDNKWIWYCHEQNGYLLSQSDKTYDLQSSCIENAKKNGYSDKSVLPLFLHVSCIHGKGWKWYQCYKCGYIIKESPLFFLTFKECIHDAQKNISPHRP